MIYLHFLDRELRNSVDSKLNDKEVKEILYLTLFMKDDLYCSYSHLYENHDGFSESIKLLLEISEIKNIKFYNSTSSFEEFIEKKHKEYYHDKERYPCYFTDKPLKIITDDKITQNLNPKNNTNTLTNKLLEIYDNEENLQKFLIDNKEKANTIAKFDTYINELHLLPEEHKSKRKEIALKISEIYTKGYINLVDDGKIITNINGLEHFDFLCSEKIFTNMRIYKELNQKIISDWNKIDYKTINWAEVQNLCEEIIENYRMESADDENIVENILSQIYKLEPNDSLDIIDYLKKIIKTFEDIEINRNHQYIQELKDKFIYDDSIVVFIGAGLSMPFNVPRWKDLIKKIAEKFIAKEQENQKNKIYKKNDERDYWGAIKLIQQYSGTKEVDIQKEISNIIRRIEDQFSDSSKYPDNNYLDLSKFGKIATTNYDNFIEKVTKYSDITTEGSEDSYSSLFARKNVVYHLHGSAERPSTIVISKDKYDELYNNPRGKQFIDTLLGSKTILFLGVSFTDKFLMDLIVENSNKTRNQHYAITFNLEDKKIKNLREKNNIRCIDITETDREKRVLRIREIINEIIKKPQIIIFHDIFENNDVREFLEKNFECDYEEKFFIIYNYDNNRICEVIKILQQVAKNEKKIIYMHNVILENKDILDYNTKLMENLIEETTDESYGLIIDKHININLDETLVKVFREGIVKIKEHDYSFYVSETMNIKNAETIGVEVHASTTVFFYNKILLIKRKDDEINAPNCWATPGGKLKKQELFEDAALRKLKEECNIKFEKSNLKILNTYKVKDRNIPGVMFYVNKFTGAALLNENQKYFSLQEVKELNAKNELANDLETMKKAFELNLKDEIQGIKIRVILSTICNFKCQLCHHENIHTQMDTNLDEIQNTLRSLSQVFDLKKITITGGETFLDSTQLFKIVDFIKENITTLYPISIITNGSAVQQHLSKLKEYGDFLRLKISLYGYDQQSFEKYTQGDGLLKNYKDKMLNLFKELNNDNYLKNYTLNIVYNKIIKNGLFSFLKELSNLRKEDHLDIKIIDMVKSQDNNKFDELYVDTKELYDGDFATGGGMDFNNLFTVKKDGIKFQIYKYPCYNKNNCKNCFENFALTIKPDGSMIICKKAINERIEEILKNANINIEWVDFKEMYEI
jgi:ADP-ribose pyrophosphatase YjhB (NUDIX family)/uncharacterized Fe-S cluster-containing radical SAM superfamily protein